MYPLKLGTTDHLIPNDDYEMVDEESLVRPGIEYSEALPKNYSVWLVILLLMLLLMMMMLLVVMMMMLQGILAKYLDIWLFGCAQKPCPSGVSLKRALKM